MAATQGAHHVIPFKIRCRLTNEGLVKITGMQGANSVRQRHATQRLPYYLMCIHVCVLVERHLFLCLFVYLEVLHNLSVARCSQLTSPLTVAGLP